MKKILTIAGAIIVAGCGSHNGTDTGDMPELPRDSISIDGTVAECGQLNVRASIPAYELELEVGTDVNSSEVHSQSFLSEDAEREYHAIVETCDSEGNLLPGLSLGTNEACLWMTDGTNADEVCQEFEIQGDTNPLSLEVACSPGAQIDGFEHANKAKCEITDIVNLEGTPTCELRRQGSDEVLASNDCGTPLVDQNAPQGTVNYGVRLTENPSGRTAEDSQAVDMNYEKPSIGECVTGGSPGAWVSANCQRAEPTQPDGYSTLFQVVNTNLPAEAGGWLIDQEFGDHISQNQLPDPYNMDELSLTTQLCVDYNGNGEVDAEETNCDEKTIDNF